MIENDGRAREDGFSTLDELVEAVNRWCREERIRPVSGQASEELTARTVRFYRAKGLMDAPRTGKGGYRRKHFLQLCAIRILQAQALPLSRIQELLYGRSEEELEEILRRGVEERPPESAPLLLRGKPLQVYTLDEGCALLSWTPLRISDELRRAILELLARARGCALPPEDEGQTDPEGPRLPEREESRR